MTLVVLCDRVWVRYLFFLHNNGVCVMLNIPSIARKEKLDPYKYTQYILENQLQVYHQPTTLTDMIYVGVVVHAGSKHEKHTGVAHFLEHLICTQGGEQGMSAFPGVLSEDFKKLENVRFHNAKTHFLFTLFVFTLIPGKVTLDDLLAYLGGIFFQQEIVWDIESERKVIVSEYHARYTENSCRVDKTSAGILYPETVFANQPIITGTEEDIERITVDNIRAFRDMAYKPEHMSLVVNGNVDTNTLLSSVEESPFGVHGEIDTQFLEEAQMSYARLTAPKFVYLDQEGLLADQPRMSFFVRWAMPTEDLSFIENMLIQHTLYDVFTQYFCREQGMAYGVDMSPFWLGEVVTQQLFIKDAVRCKKRALMQHLKKALSRQTLLSAITQAQKTICEMDPSSMVSWFDRCNEAVDVLGQTGDIVNFTTQHKIVSELDIEAFATFMERYITSRNCVVGII